MRIKLQIRKILNFAWSVSLLCQEINTPFYNNHYISAMHSDEDPKTAMSFTVPAGHEDAKQT